MLERGKNRNKKLVWSLWSSSFNTSISISVHMSTALTMISQIVSHNMYIFRYIKCCAAIGMHTLFAHIQAGFFKTFFFHLSGRLHSKSFFLLLLSLPLPHFHCTVRLKVFLFAVFFPLIVCFTTYKLSLATMCSSWRSQCNGEWNIVLCRSPWGITIKSVEFWYVQLCVDVDAFCMSLILNRSFILLLRVSHSLALSPRSVFRFLNSAPFLYFVSLNHFELSFFVILKGINKKGAKNTKQIKVKRNEMKQAQRTETG